MISCFRPILVVASLGLALAACNGCNNKALENGTKADSGLPQSTSLTPEQAAKVLAKVGDKTITLGDFVATLEHMDQFDRLRYHNSVSRIDDGTEGWSAEAPFDGILVTAGGPRIPDPLLAQLADPGRLVIPVGDQGVQDLQLVEKRDGGLTVRTIEQVRFVDLIGAYGWPS